MPPRFSFCGGVFRMPSVARAKPQIPTAGNGCPVPLRGTGRCKCPIKDIFKGNVKGARLKSRRPLAIQKQLQIQRQQRGASFGDHGFY
jgi:hypothetical protein